ncbi:MAG: sulfatase, partial [Planctomycetota bacterium]
MLLSETMQPRDVGDIKQFHYKDCALDSFEDTSCRLIFRCFSDSERLPEEVRCGWGNVKIDSSGKRDLLKRIGFKRSEVAYDFLDLLRGRSGTGKIVWARVAEQREYKADLPWGVDDEFTPFFDVQFPELHKKASIVFGQDARIHVPDITIPDKEAIELVFSTGLREAAAAAGGATFTIHVQDQELFRETVTGRHFSDMWRRHSIDLSPFAGRTVEISFAVEYAPFEPGEFTLSSEHPLAAGGEGVRLRVERSLAAFGHPVLVWSEKAGRRFPSKKKAPNLILINIDSLSKTYLGCYGAPFGLTPCMDRMAEVGILFRDFCASSSQPLPSVASVLSGRYPSAHGAGLKDRSYLAHHCLSLARSVQQRNGTTAAFVAGQGISRYAGLDQGFETYVSMPGQNARKVNALFNDWLIANGDFRFFAYLHYCDPHAPFHAPAGLEKRYVPSPLQGKVPANDPEVLPETETMTEHPALSPEEEVEYLRGKYFGEVEYLDRRIQDLLSLLGEFNLMKDTVIVVTGSYGQAFMEHGVMGHGSDLYNESILVPLILCGPDQIIGPHQVVEGMADHASLFATCARLMGFDPNEVARLPIQPTLFPLEERSSYNEPYAWSEIYKVPEGGGSEGRHLCSIMDWRYKLISDGALHELYNLVDDPLEQNNMAEIHLPV